jgi:radical SAM protein with 4Fe4S-binding SPASM domain
LKKVISGAKKLVKWKKELNSTTPHIIFQFLVIKPNEHQIEDIYTLAAKIGIDEVKIKTAQLYNFEEGNELMPTNELYSRYKKNSNGKYSLKNKLYNHCWKMWHSTVITWDGTVVPCCFDKDAQYPMGSLVDKPFFSIWQDKNYTDFRQTLLQNRNKIDICKNCIEGSKIFLK